MKVKFPCPRLDQLPSPHHGWWFDRRLECKFKIPAKPPNSRGKILLQYYLDDNTTEPWQTKVVYPSTLVETYNGEPRYTKVSVDVMTEEEFAENLRQLEDLINS